jgi:hypothetical protein
MAEHKSSTNSSVPPPPPPLDDKTIKQTPGEGIRSLKTSAAFRALNFELYAKPV